MNAVPWHADALMDNVLPMCPSPSAFCITLFLCERYPRLSWRGGLCRSFLFVALQCLGGLLLCVAAQAMDMKSPLVFSIILGRWHHPIPPAHLLPVPVWSIAICKFWLACTGLSNLQLFGWQPAILFHQSNPHIALYSSHHTAFTFGTQCCSYSNSAGWPRAAVVSFECVVYIATSSHP